MHGKTCFKSFCKIYLPKLEFKIVYGFEKINLSTKIRLKMVGYANDVH